MTDYYESFYLPTEAKIALAKSIVEEFPVLEDTHSFDGFEHFFDPTTCQGFIEYRLTNLRKKLSPSKKKYSTNKTKITNVEHISIDNSKNVSDGIINEKICMMKLKMPTENNKTIIINALQDTYNNKRAWIKKDQPTMKQILETYPRLQDFNGKMIDLEFHKMYPEQADNFLSEFTSIYVPRILNYAKQVHPELFKTSGIIENVGRKRIKGAVNNGKKKICKSNETSKEEEEMDEVEAEEVEPLNTSFPNPFLLRFVSEGMNLHNFEQTIRKNSIKNIQPYLIMAAGQQQDSIFIQGDGIFISIPKNSDNIVAFDILYKCFYIFNVAYPEKLNNFYEFIDKYIFKMNIKTKSSVSSLHVNMMNMNLTE